MGGRRARGRGPSEGLSGVFEKEDGLEEGEVGGEVEGCCCGEEVAGECCGTRVSDIMSLVLEAVRVCCSCTLLRVRLGRDRD